MSTHSRFPAPSADAAHHAKAVIQQPLNQPPGMRTEQLIREDRLEASKHYTCQRTLCITLLAIIGGLVIVAIILAVVLQAPSVHHTLMESMKLVHTKDGTGIPMAFTHITGLFPYKFTMHGISIVDPVGNKVRVGSAQVHVALMSALKGLIEVHSVTVLSAGADIGGEYVEDNTDYTEAEVLASIKGAGVRSRNEIWPNIPLGIKLNKLEVKNFVAPVEGFENQTFSIEGAVEFKRFGGDFNVSLLIAGAGHVIDLKMVGRQILHHVALNVNIRNSSLLCVKSGEECYRPINISNVFYNERQPYSLESRTDISIRTDATWSGLLQAAFPSKSAVNKVDLMAGTISTKTLSPDAIYRTFDLVFALDGNRSVVIHEGRITSPLLHQATPLRFQAGFTRKAPYQFMLLVEQQHLSLPLPVGDVDFAFAFDDSLNGTIALNKYDVFAKYIQWESNATFSVDFENTELDVKSLSFSMADNQLDGDALISYSPNNGFEVLANLQDEQTGASSVIRLSPYYSDALKKRGIARQYQLHIGFKMDSFTSKKMHIEDIRISTDIYSIPLNPHGSMAFALGRVDYGNGVFVMNNASIDANRQEQADPTDTSSWKVTASSDQDLRTKFTLYLTGSEMERTFSGSISPFQAVLYGKHRVWTTDPSTIGFDYHRMTYSLHSTLHANQANPSRRSLEVIASNQRSRLLINEDISLFNTILPQKYQGSGLIQGFVEVEHAGGPSYPSSIDLCWTNGRLFTAPTADTPSYQVWHEFSGCVNGRQETGWTIDNPPASFVVDNPPYGRIQMKSNITASRQWKQVAEVDTSVVQLDLQMEFLTVDDQEINNFFQGGWIAAEGSFDINM